MKHSDSKTSLTELKDPVCNFCTELADIESGRHLIDSKNFLNCACEFSTHKDCWITYIHSKPEEEIATCPICQKSVASWRSIIYTNEPPDEKKNYSNFGLCIFFLAIVSVFGLIAGVAISH